MVNEQSRVHRDIVEMKRLIDYLKQHNKRFFIASENKEVSINDEREVMLVLLRSLMDNDYASSIRKRASDSVEHRRSKGVFV